MVIMDGGQHGPPRREVWSYLQNHSALFKQASGESLVLISPLPNLRTHHDDLELTLLTSLSRFFQRSIIAPPSPTLINSFTNAQKSDILPCCRTLFRERAVIVGRRQEKT